LRGKFWCRPAAVTQDRKHPTIDGQEELEKRQQGDAPGMKENVLDVLMYLFETYIDAEEEPEQSQNPIKTSCATNYPERGSATAKLIARWTGSTV
jgi:hypothetical protein